MKRVREIDRADDVHDRELAWLATLMRANELRESRPVPRVRAGKLLVQFFGQ